MGLQTMSPPMTSRAALVTTIPMIAVTVIVRGDATSWERIGAFGVLAYRVQSDCPRVPAPQAPRIEVIPKRNAQPTFGAVPGWWNMLPEPPAWDTALWVVSLWLSTCELQFIDAYQISRPVQVPQNKTKQMTNGICSFSGLTRTNGTKTNIQMMRPMKSLVSRCELSAK